MSATVEPFAVLEDTPPAALPGRGVRRWLAPVAAVAVLAVAGGIRFWQQGQLSGFMASGQVSPFPLKDLPKTIGHWRQISDTGLDPAIARGAGSTDAVNRTYIDDQTGVRLSVLVLYGRAMHMQFHKPEACYPASGYTLASPPSQHPVEYQSHDGQPRHAEVRTLVFAKGEGPAAVRSQVTYAWGRQGHWSTELPNVKAFHRIPGMFKVHIDRMSFPGESGEIDTPAEQFLKDLLPEIDARAKAATTQAATATAAR